MVLLHISLFIYYDAKKILYYLLFTLMRIIQPKIFILYLQNKKRGCVLVACIDGASKNSREET